MIINGRKYDFSSMTISEMVRELGINEDRIVVELNYEIIKKEEFKIRIVNKEDKIEIVSFVGGG